MEREELLGHLGLLELPRREFKLLAKELKLTTM